MAGNFDNIEEALRRLGREGLIDTFRRELFSDGIMDLIVRDPTYLALLVPIVPEAEARDRVVAMYTFVRGDESLAVGAARARGDPIPLANVPAKGPQGSKVQVKGVDANKIKRVNGA